MKRALALLCAAAALILSCSPKENPEPPVVQESLTVSPASLSFSADGTQVEKVAVTASGAWTASAGSSWIKVEPASGSGNASVNVSASYNAMEKRSGKITFKLGSLSREVTVSQAEAEATQEVPVEPNPVLDGKKRSNTAYQVLIYSFADSDGDGVGDFKGIQNKLDYLDKLGVTALWLSPAHPTSSYHAYDVDDYYAVNPLYGSEADFKALIDAAHAKGIAIYMDYVLNHSGRNNAWFQEALADPSSKYRDYYFFSANPSADYGKFPMLTGTKYVSGEWKQATTGSPKLTVSKTEEAVTAGNCDWNLWVWKSGQSGQAVKFVNDGNGSYHLVMEFDGSYGILLRKYMNWDAGSKFGAQSGNATLKEGTPLDLVGDGADISFSGKGRYRIDLTNVSTETLYYMGCFSDHMPDLNYGDVSVAENNACFKDLAASADKWIGMGVDGFRLDAVKHICGGIDSYNNESNRILLKKWYDHCNETYKAAGHSDNIFMVCEMWDSHSQEKLYYGSLRSCFEFDYGYKVRDMLNNGNASGFVSSVSSYVSDHLSIRSDAVTSFFLSNHDQNRIASELDQKEARVKQAGAILLTSPGKPFIYQGEELGYWGKKDNGDEYVRTPMMWDKAGKDCARKGVEGKVDSGMLTSSISVEAQEASAESQLAVYRRFSQLRNSYPALASGTMSQVSLSGTGFAAWYMTSTDGSQKLLVVHNVTGSAKSVTLSDKLTNPIALLGTASVTGKSLKLGANSSVVFEL